MHESARVHINELKKEMVILAYIGFTKKYKSLDESTCRFLKKHFEGTKSVVDRSGNLVSINTANLKEGDRLFRIQSFPSKLKRLTVVNEQLVRALRSHGMLRFEVEKPVSLSLDSKKELKELIDLVNTQVENSF